MKLKSTLTATILLALVIVSAIGLNTTHAQEPNPPPPKDAPALSKDRQFNGTYLSWSKQQNTTQETWSWTSQAWEFGPYPNFAVYLQNGTEITDDNYVPLGTPFVVVINIQKNIFMGNSTLGRAGLQWYTELRNQNGTSIGNANCRMVYVNQMQTKYWNESNTWHIESFVFNQSDTGMGKELPKEGPPPPEQMRQFSFYLFDNSSSRILESTDTWRIEIAGSFNATSTPVGPFWVNLEVTDQSDSWLDFGYRAWQGKRSPQRMVAVGKKGFVYGGYMDSWNFEKTDMDNQPTYSVSKGSQWKMRFNVTSSELTNITIGLDLAWNVKTYVNISNWYQRTVTQQGGWMYNETSDAYYWNSSVSVTRTEQVYGPHLEERWINTPHGKQINVTRSYWDPATGQQQMVTEQQWVQEKLFLIYDHTSSSFSMKQGYSYSAWDPLQQRDREFQTFYDVNASDLATRFYNLSLTDSKVTVIESNKFCVEFVGEFSNTTYSDRDEYWVQIAVNSLSGQVWANWESFNPSDFQIIVDRPVAISTILDSRGRPIKGWMFQTDLGNSFIVQSKLYGAGNLYTDIDGVGVNFRTGYGKWSANESYNSDVEIRLIKDLTTGTLSSVTYNRTSRNAYVYGPHRGWAYVNVTDWHMGFNATTGMWEWIYSSHLQWNETTIADWHWENSRLNQTEYARDPNSLNVWMDVTTKWVNDNDPAFQMPISYAVLNSANMSLVKGLVVVNMSVTFQPGAAEGNYWWNMVFQNMTYGRDWSQGWGEHTVTEWTSEQIYYVNGSVTSNQAWYVSRPTTPLYTMYDGTKYLLDQTPYIIINNEYLPIKVRSQYDQWRQEEWTEYLLRDPYDPVLKREPRYYQLLNGTKIFVQEAYQAIIRTLQLNCTDAYTMTGGVKASLPNGTVIDTYMNRAGQDWAEHFWDPVLQQDIVPYNYELLNGTRIYRNQPFETTTYNTTTSHWEISDTGYTESLTTLLVDSVGSGVSLNKTIVLLREPGNWQSLPDGSGYFLVMRNGTRITIRDPWGVPDNQRWVTIDGRNWLIGWPNQYYTGTFNGQTLYIRGGGWEGYVRNYYYTDLGVEGGTEYELPYPGAMATSWWDLEGLESEGRKLRTFKSMTMNGEKYVLHFDEDTKSYYIVIGGVQHAVTYPMMDVGYYYSKINGEDNWSMRQNGWILKYGEYYDKSGQFSSTGTLITTTGYDPIGHMWSEYNRYGYDRENATIYLTLTNGTRKDLDSGIYLMVWQVQLGNQTYYTTDSYDRMEMVTDNRTGQTMYMNYFQTLDGEKVYFNWNDRPASWQEELHIQIPGTNYTKLIPYTWQPQQVFDTIYVYNITIPSLPYNATSTGVYCADGSEVAVNATVKVFGTRYGPGTRYNYGWNGSQWVEWGGYVPSANAPWNSTLYVSYFTALNGTRIYSTQNFGWMGNHWGNPAVGEVCQWRFINGDSVAGNKTATVVEGGYCIYLNDTVRVDVTTANPQGGMPDQYLTMTNGTYLTIHWRPDLNKYHTMIGDRDYYFRQVNTYHNLTDSGTVYTIADPFDSDYRRILSPSTYLAPVVSTNRDTWVWMNSTSESILNDADGYYLVNASDTSRLNLTLVSNWWNLSAAVRRQVFQNWVDELRDCYPRFNVTLNGIEYFVIDPSPVVGRWDGEGSIQNAMYRYPRAINVTLDGTTYTIALFEVGGYWRYDLRWRMLQTILISGTRYEVEEQHQWKPSYIVTISSTDLDVNLEAMNIYKRHQIWGELYTWMLTDMSVSTARQVNDIVVGTPKYGMWGIQAFTVVEDTGAIDLDGDLETTSDQYFVRRLHTGSNTRNETIDRMWVELIWDPNASLIDDEIHIGAWMGKLHVSWTTEWSETYMWYYASNMTHVSDSVMQTIQSTVIDSATETPNPGYWDIAHMVQNQTWADLLERAKREHWDWMTSNTNEWEWMWFGTQQDYVTNWATNNGTQSAGIGLRYEFAGLTLFNGSEQTHFFMPKNIGNVTFATPGEAFGNMNATDSMIVSLNKTITFGVTFDNINGTLFPYSEDRSMWGWWDRPIFGADFQAPNFINKPTPSSVEDVSFAIHFSGNQTSDADLNNKASMKIDQRIGDWELEPNVIDGREVNSSGVMVPMVGNDVLTNRSLATNYYVTAFSGVAWDVMDDKGSSVDNNNSTESSTFSVASKLANASFATVKLGSTYDWSKPTTTTDIIRTLNVTSKTSPIGTFRASFQSDSGKSSAGFDFSAAMYFLTVGFQKWDGYAITNDPEVAFQLSKGTVPPPEEETPEEEIPEEGQEEAGLLGAETPWAFIILGSTVAVVVTLLIVFRAKVKRGLARLRGRKAETTPKPRPLKTGAKNWAKTTKP
jgi:hypothetical protein